MKNLNEKLSQALEIEPIELSSIEDKPELSEGTDVVEVKDGYYKVTGRISDVINVGGLKFMASEVERVALQFPNVSLVKATPKSNPITGQHVELLVQPTSEDGIDRVALLDFLKDRLQPHMVPKRVRIESVAVGHRFKKA